MPAAELQRFFTTKINGLSGQSPFQGKMLRNKLIKKPLIEILKRRPKWLLKMAKVIAMVRMMKRRNEDDELLIMMVRMTMKGHL